MEKLRYGTKEIIATLIAVVLIVGSRWVEMTFFTVWAGGLQISDWIRLRVLIVAVAAIFFGPATGLISGLSGDLLINTVYSQTLGYPEIIAMGLYGLFLGVYFGKTHFDLKCVDGRNLLDFNITQIMAGVFLALFFIPMLSFLTEGADLGNAVSAGARYAVGNALMVGIICPVIMLAASALARGSKRGAP